MEIKNSYSNKGNILKGVYIINPNIFEDKRGLFYESWNQLLFDNAIGEKIIFSQDNHSSSNCGVLRGLHYQIEPKAQGKLVRCTSGSIFDVAVDIRKSSPTFSEWTSVTLNNKNKSMLWIPIGFAHGFLSLEDNSEVQYKASGFWSKEMERTIRWNDEKINIKWPIQDINLANPILSEKDNKAPLLETADIFK